MATPLSSEPPNRTVHPSITPTDSPVNSSPDTSPISSRRPLTALAWGRPETCVSPQVRPSTTIGWESRVLEKATLGHGGGRRHSAGTRQRNVTDYPDWSDRIGEMGGKPSTDGSEGQSNGSELCCWCRSAQMVVVVVVGG